MQRTAALAEMLSGALEGDDTRKGAAGAPNATAQARELHDLRMVDEEVRAGTLILDVIREDLGICCFKPEERRTYA